MELKLTFLVFSIVIISAISFPEINAQQEEFDIVKFDKEKYKPSDIITITVKDYLANFDSGLRDTVKVQIISSLFSKTMTLTETGEDTDIFTGKISLASEQMYGTNRVKTPITVHYLNPKLFDSAVICCTQSLPQPPNDKIDAIDAIPYKITLLNDKEQSNVMKDITYKVEFSSEHDFELVNPIQGTFDSMYLENKKTMIFQADKLEPGQMINGIVGIHSTQPLIIGENGMIEKGPKFDLKISVTSNGETITKIVDPWWEVTEIVTKFVEAARSVFDLSVDVYTITVPCFNLTVDDEQGEDVGIGVSIPIVMENCSEHPQKVSLRAELIQSVDSSFDSNNFDIDSHKTKENHLTIVGMGIPDGTYKFKIFGDVIYDVFGETWKSTSSEGEGWFNVTNGKAVAIPEFPLSIIILVASFIPLVILFRNKRINKMLQDTKLT